MPRRTSRLPFPFRSRHASRGPGRAPAPLPQRPPTLTHAPTDDLVVFHIGMTIRARHRPDLWAPVLLAMPPMISELVRNRDAAARGETEDLGFLHAEMLIGKDGPWVMQYWRSADHLYAYARDPHRVHLPAWKRFNAAARAHPGAVGIWHETHLVPASGIESVYVGGAAVGLARAVGTVPVSARGRAARERLLGAGRAPGSPAPPGQGSTSPHR
ncbi:DUF4188 domain-containing protein [Brachybacterium hainanense]|uniref:DUF4188 domain-containing protein n=1 Tax=Brachybacterium hainanense TaxID=1541174 RepID=A0ABV6R6N0_9MICO